MKAFRDSLSFWNETGLIVSVVLSVGYFGSRQLLGYLPQFTLALLVIGAIVLASFLSRGGGNEDDYEERNKPLDRFIWLTACFLLGMGLFTFLGTLL